MTRIDTQLTDFLNEEQLALVAKFMLLRYSREEIEAGLFGSWDVRLKGGQNV